MTNRVIDERCRGWLWIDNAIIDKHAQQIGVHSLAVYAVLCRFADQSGTCFPGIDTIAERLGIAPNTVRKAIRILQEAGLVRVEERTDADNTRKSNRYILPQVQEMNPTLQAVQGDPSPDAGETLHAVNPNKTQLNKTHGTRVAPGGAPPNPEPNKPSSSEKPNQTPPVPNHPPRPPRRRKARRLISPSSTPG